jgi:hypothetical protein
VSFASEDPAGTSAPSETAKSGVKPREASHAQAPGELEDEHDEGRRDRDDDGYDDEDGPYRIKGTVRGEAQELLPDARVVVWWQRMRTRAELVAGHTSRHGDYHLTYRLPRHAPRPVLLVVEALSERLQAPLCSPPTEAQPELEVDLRLTAPDDSEWATLCEAVEPLLDGVGLGELVEDSSHQDIAFLARELRTTIEAVMRLTVSARLEATFGLPAPAFYAFLRQRVPAALPSPLLEASDEFSLIDPLVQSIGSSIFSLPAQTQTQTLTAAVALDLIGPQFTAEIPRIVEELQARRTTDLLEQPYLVGKTTLAELLGVAGVEPAKQQAFAQALATNAQPMNVFWDALREGKSGLTAAEAEAIERTLSIGAFVKNFLPLVQALYQGFSAGTYQTLADLARLSKQEWVTLVERTGVPPSTDPAGPASPAEVFAGVVYARVTRAYPTAALAGRIATGAFVPRSVQQPLTAFLQHNSELELVRDNLPAYVAKHGEKAFEGVAAEDRATVVTYARRFQRVMRVASSPDVAETLLGLGFGSAAEINSLGEQQFFEKATAAGLTKREANTAFRISAQRYASTVSLFMKLNRGSLGVWPAALGELSQLDAPIQQALKRDQSLETLFGSQDYCATEGCASILSPAAYLCDLLLWLRYRKQTTGAALDVLDERRPDIRHLLLNCANTEIELPYIDLVNELLADKISPPVDLLAATYTQTALLDGTVYYYVVTAVNAVGEGLPSSQVSASPQAPVAVPPAPTGLVATPEDGQVTLAWNPVPGASSYNVYWSTASGVTPANGTAITGARNPRWKQTTAGKTAAELAAAPEYFNQGAYVVLFAADYPFSLPYSTGLDELRTWLQQLKLPLWQLRDALLPYAGASTSQRAAVGAERLELPPHAAELIAQQNLLPPAVAWNTANPQVELAPVPAFLQAASITYESLLELLQVTWVQGGLGVALQGVDDTCATSNQHLSALPPAFLDRAHRFLRLWLAAGLKMWELGLLLEAPAVGNGALDENALAALLDFQKLQDQTKLAVDQQLAFFQDIDTATHRDPDGSTTTSLYASVYLNPAVVSVAPDADLAAVASGGPLAKPALSEHLPGIQGALAVTAAEAETLISLTDGQLTLANLSLIYRVRTLAVAAKCSLSQLLVLARLLAPAAGDAATAVANLFSSPAATSSFLEQAGATLQASLSLDAITYVLTPPSATTLVAAITAAQTSIQVASSAGFPSANFYVTVGTETMLVTAVAGVGDTEWTVVRGQLTTPAAPAVGGAPVELVGSWPTTTQMTEANIEAALASVRKAVLGGAANANGAAISAIAENAHAAGASGIANDVAALILERLKLPGTTETLLEALVEPTFTGSDAPIAPAAFPKQFLAVRLFDKVAVLVRALRFVVSDLEWLLENAAVYGGLDLTALPVTVGQPAVALQALLETLLLVKLARSWTAAPPSASIQTLYELIGEVHAGTLADATAAQTALASVTGWPVADVHAFAGALGPTFPAAYTEPRAYEALRTLEAMAHTTRATGAQLVEWGISPLAEPAAEAMAAGALAVVKALQPTEEAWLTLATKLMNQIRERRSAALQAYLVAERNLAGEFIYEDADGLLDYFLIDTQMSSCQPTSRMVQAYIAVQIFVTRCLMGLEAPAVVVNLEYDRAWSEWEWMSRYRIWEANREVFLYPENWLIESQRPNRTETFKTLEQEVHQGTSTSEYLEGVVLNYIERLDGLAHLNVTGTCEDPDTGDIYVVARTQADPPVFYIRSYTNGAWMGWEKIPLDIRAQQVVPALYRGRVCLFWLGVKTANERAQPLPPAEASSTPPKNTPERYVSLALSFSMFANGSWGSAQTAKGQLFDKPFFGAMNGSDAATVEALYTLKVHAPVATANLGARLFVDVFRLGEFDETQFITLGSTIDLIAGLDESVAIHLGRAIFDGRFAELELRNFGIPMPARPLSVLGLTEVTFSQPEAVPLLAHAQEAYGPEAQPLLPLAAGEVEAPLATDSSLVPRAGAMASPAAQADGPADQTIQLNFTSASSLEQNVGPLLNTAPLPFRVIGPDSELGFDPTSYFFFQDSRRCYWVQSVKYYWTGSTWAPVAPSNPASAPYQLRYYFHVFYNPFTGLFWQELAGGGFDLLYEANLQENPDQIDPSGADVFSFEAAYQPQLSRVRWDHDDVTGQDRQFLDFRPGAAFAVYNWELFYHIPMYVAELLSQNQQFEDAQSWYRYVFDPTRQGSEPVPQRFWIPKPLHNLTPGEIAKQQINVLLEEVNRGNAGDVAEVERWREQPFNPFVIADQRPVAYMKATVMAYLENLIAWGDNLFSTESREALSEATLLYVVASEILGPQPVAVEPPKHADESFDQLEPALDAFANAMVEIENVLGVSGSTTTAGEGAGGAIPAPQTFYFKIPSNEKLLGYWSTVGDRLYKLRHCENIAGAPLQLPLFDAPIDPGLLVAAQAASQDASSVLSDIAVRLPSYRFVSLYPQALDFVNAVRAYGSSLQAALEKSDAGTLALMQQVQQQQLLSDGSQVLEWQVEQAQRNLDALHEGLRLSEQKYKFNSSQDFMNIPEGIGTGLHLTAGVLKVIAAATTTVAAVAAPLPQVTAGAAGIGGSPVATVTDGGPNVAKAAHMAGITLSSWAEIAQIGADLSNTIGTWERRKDNWNEAATEAKIQSEQTEVQMAAGKLAVQIAEQNQTLHEEQIANLEKQINFLNEKFTSDGLYDWMVGSLSATYFQSYQLAYQLCKQLEQCYRFELGVQDTSFIGFGYWDSLYKGLLAGESLNQDLRRMQASYLQGNSRRLEASRFVSLALLDPVALEQLLITGACDFDLPESLFDNDYPGHYFRRLTRMSVTVVYPNPGKFDNVKATLTMVANKVRSSTAVEAGKGYAEEPVGSDQRFEYNYAAVPQKIVLGNAQDDPGMFTTAISSNIADQRYLPFENAGAISSWHLEMPAATNEIDLSTVGDVVLHLYYTAIDGGEPLKQEVENYNEEQRPTTGVKLFSAQNDFSAPAPTAAEPYPLTPWQTFLSSVAAPANQTLTLSISPSKFPAWTRGKTISATSLTLIAVAWPPGEFVLAPQTPLPTSAIPMTVMAGVSEPNLCSATVPLPANTPLGKWSFEIQRQGAADFRSLTKNEIGDVLLLVSYSVS